MDKNKKQIVPMTCPVCGKFYFTKLTEDDFEDGITPNDVQCYECGWHYDLEQLKDPNLENQSNKLSLNKYKEEYKKILASNPKYNYLDSIRPEDVPYKCPVCGEFLFERESSFEICPICGWQDDDYFEGGGANELSLEESISIFKTKRAENPNYKWFNKTKK